MSGLAINFFEHLEDVSKQFQQKELFIFLDYDGTLTPIVETPEKAVMAEDTREAVRRVSLRFKTAIVSGRATDDVRSKVQIENIFYAGSHGFEIVSPDGKVVVNEDARKFLPVIDEAHKKLSQQLKGVPGALVEHVKYTISAHYRLVSDEDFPKVEQAVAEILAAYPNLRKTSGKKVFEIRPKIDWHKGKAVEWILQALKFDPQKNLAVYIGDDTTDEDAFGALKDKGFGILVAEHLRPTKARYWIKDTEDVKKVLEIFVKETEKQRGRETQRKR